MPPLWKIKREAKRLLNQVKSAPADLLGYYLANPYYDKYLIKKSKKNYGAIPEGNKIGIYLILPTHGIQPSHIAALKYITKNGYSPILVSNLPLSEPDRKLALENSWKVIERPNFGYDFGGYRDAIISIEDKLPELERLIILNDSCWFPIPNRKNWIEEAEKSNLDFVGSVSNRGINTPEDFQDNLHWKYSHENRKDYFYSSFSLSMGRKILKDVSFLEFWREMRLSNNKTKVVQRGEVGLSRWVIENNFTHGSTINSTALDENLRKLSTQRLIVILKNFIPTGGAQFKAERKRVLSDECSNQREKVINLILLGVARFGTSYSLADFNINDQGYCFLKKSPLSFDQESLNITLSMIDSFAEPARTAWLNEAHLLMKAKPVRSKN